MLCPYLLISINELLISIISFNDINKYGLNVKTAAHKIELFRRPTNTVLKSRNSCQSPCQSPQCRLQFKLSGRFSIPVDDSIREHLYFILVCRFVSISEIITSQSSCFEKAHTLILQNSKKRRPHAGRKFFIPSMIAGTLAVIGCNSLLFYARISLDSC